MKAEIAAEPTAESTAKPEPVNFEQITADEREQITFWKGFLQRWETFRASAASKAEGDLLFEHLIRDEWEKMPPPLNIEFSIATLYRKQKVLRTEGEAGLIDRRGKHGNHKRKLTAEMILLFENRYLNDSKPSVRLCVDLVYQDLKKKYGCEVELPSIKTFERHVDKIPIPTLALYRDGIKAFEGKYAPYISRDYTDLEPNDIWVVDGHTLDIMIRGKNGKPVRMYIRGNVARVKKK